MGGGGGWIPLLDPTDSGLSLFHIYVSTSTDDVSPPVCHDLPQLGVYCVPEEGKVTGGK
jgi:hypothetical protein